MSRVKDETGNIYGKLTVLGRAENNKAGKAQWLCKCECGNTTIVIGGDLRQGRIKSCGCLKNEKLREGNYIDLTNKKFERLTVLFPVKEKTNGLYWHCKCDCGNECDVKSTHLMSNQIRSCGCLRRENRIEANHILHFQNLVGQKFGLLLVLEELEERTSEGKRQWKCQCDCGNIINIETALLTSKQKQSCGCLKISKAELEIKTILEKNHIDFIQEYKPKDSTLSFNARFDFYLPSLNTLIEYDGRQHFEMVEYFGGQQEFESRQAHDKEKNNWALNNNYFLIRIPYTHNKICLEDLLPKTSTFLINK